MNRKEKPAGRARFSLLALISFVASFVIARVFTSISPSVVLRWGSVHIHHFWYGIVLLAIGSWLWISSNEERITRLAAVICGAGGGLIADEAGLLLTFGNYRTGITFTIVVLFVAFASAFILLQRYSKSISAEIKGFTRSRVSFYFGVILAAVSIAFLSTRRSLIAQISAVTTVVACIIITAYVLERIGARHREEPAPVNR